MVDNQTALHDVNRLADALVAAWNDHDAEAFARPFAADADFTNVFGMKATGREAIAQFHKPVFQTIFRDSVLNRTGGGARLLRPDVASLDMQWSMTGARSPTGEEWPQRRGLINLVATSQDGTWSIAVMHNMDLPPEEMAQAQAAIQAN